MENDSLTGSFNAMTLFRPPIVRSAAATLDRSLFAKTIPISAARIANKKNISKHRADLLRTKESLQLERLSNIQPDPDPSLASKGGKCVLLKPSIKVEDPETWSSVLREAAGKEEILVIPYELKLDYNYWNYYDIITALLPEDAQEEIPSGFALVGHVAHLNLHDEYLPYKKIIAEVLMDKNPTVRTVINKTDDVGVHSEFRTFEYEVLAGDDNMDVEVREGECTFRFNYSKVYWNSRLQTEHKRLVDSFSPGEVVCDVMAGVGPFAVPAGKKGVFVWANDLNPSSYSSLRDSIVRNKNYLEANTPVKVEKHVRPFCEDGYKFITHAADDLLRITAAKDNTIEIPAKVSRTASAIPPPRLPIILTIPPTINHFVMNLPAIAIDFLVSFTGLYNGREDLFEPHTETKLPMIHVHCFSTKSDDNVEEGIEICHRISAKLGYIIRPGDEELTIYDVRDVAPKKRMFCASFRLPAEVAFRSRHIE